MSILTQNGIKYLTKILEETANNTNTKKALDSDLYFQILKRKNTVHSGKDLIQLDISDGEYSFMVITLPGDVKDDIGDGDIIYSRNYTFVNGKNIFIHKINLHSKGNEVIGKPAKFANVLKNNTNHANYQESNQKSNIKPYNHQDSYDENHQQRVSSANYTPLSLLTTFTKEICILVKIVKKYPTKTFASKNGEGTLFSFNIVDRDGTEMQVTGFTKAVQKFANFLKEGAIYEVKGGYLKINDRKFANVKSEYKLMIDENTHIEEREELSNLFKEQICDYVKLSQLIEKSAFSIVDVLLYLIEVREPTVINTKTGVQMALRKVVVGDDSEFKMELTLWKEFSELPLQAGDILSIKSVKVGDFQGRSLSTIDTTAIVLNPDTNEANHLRAKVQDILKQGTVLKTAMGHLGFNDTTPVSITYIRDIMNTCNNVMDDKFSTYTIRATIINFKHEERNYYPGCSDACKKKLVREDSFWKCNACDKTYDVPIYYFTFSIRVKDASSEYYLDLFGTVGEKLLGITAQEYHDLCFNKQNDRLNKLSDAIEFKTFLFTVKPKRHYYNNTNKIKLNCYKADAADSSVQLQKTIRNLQDLLNIKQLKI
jgi:replication factor A1